MTSATSWMASISLWLYCPTERSYCACWASRAPRNWPRLNTGRLNAGPPPRWRLRVEDFRQPDGLQAGESNEVHVRIEGRLAGRHAAAGRFNTPPGGGHIRSPAEEIHRQGRRQRDVGRRVSCGRCRSSPRSGPTPTSAAIALRACRCSPGLRQHWHGPGLPGLPTVLRGRCSPAPRPPVAGSDREWTAAARDWPA